MTSIEFRAWNCCEKCWIKLGSFDRSWNDGVLRIDEEGSNLIFEQFTGFYDKNGKKIYVGDILRFKMSTGKYENYEIVFRDAMFDAINADDTNFISYSIWNTGEIVGNIHEGLLEGKG